MRERIICVGDGVIKRKEKSIHEREKQRRLGKCVDETYTTAGERESIKTSGRG